MSEDGGADGAFGPLLLAYQRQKTSTVVLVRAAQHENIVFVFLRTLLFGVLDGKLLQADHALLLFHLVSPKDKLNRMVVPDFEDIMVMLSYSFVLFNDELDQNFDGLEQRVVMLEGVLSAEGHLLLLRTCLLHEELPARLHQSKYCISKS